jgi:hypothetical protein
MQVMGPGIVLPTLLPFSSSSGYASFQGMYYCMYSVMRGYIIPYNVLEDHLEVPASSFSLPLSEKFFIFEFLQIHFFGEITYEKTYTQNAKKKNFPQKNFKNAYLL